MDPCFTPGAISPNPVIRSAIGEVVEIVIKDAYCKSKGGCHEFLKAPGGQQTDFFDVAMGFSRCRHLAAYVKMHNPHVDPIALGAECESKKLGIFKFPIPDIITHEPPGRLEFYEIKPNSDSGRADADMKIDWFLTISSANIFNLPYQAGELFTPDTRVLVWDGTWFGSPAKVHLHFFRDKKARILYEFCIEANLNTLAEMLWKQLLKAVVLALIVAILRRPERVPAPPPELPAPFPVPVPVPVPRIPVPAFLSPVESVLSPLSSSVGAGGTNDAGDVSYVQYLLGHWLANRGQASISVDGIVGPVTIGAIDQAQLEIFGHVADSLVEPENQTIARLELDHWANLIAALTVDFDGPLAGDFTTEENDEGPHRGFLPDEVITVGMQDYYNAVFEAAQEAFQ